MSARRYRIVIWFAAGLVFAFFSAITMLINQKYGLNGHLISGMRGVGVSVLYAPALLFVEFPTGKLFWSLILLEGFISTFFNARLYQSSAKYGAGSTSLISVLSIAFGLVFWWVIDYTRFLELVDTPEALWGIIFSLLLTSVGFFYMAVGVLKRGELRYMMPAVVVLAAMMINRKEIMENADFISAAVYYCVCAILFSGVANLLIYGKKFGFADMKCKLSKPRIIGIGAIMSIASAATIFAGNLSSFYVPNPAYVNALSLTTPLWVVAVDRFCGREERIKKIPALAMIIGLLCLIYFADLPLDTTGLPSSY